MRKLLAITLLGIFLFTTAGCSTRQVVDQLNGSTAQRLVTHSVDRLIDELPAAPLDKLSQQRVLLKTHFIRNDPILDYATARLRSEISERHQVTWVQQETDADYVVDAFFTSLGTDQDSFGLSLPVPTTSEGNELPRIDIIAMNMYHGISEMYFYLRDAKTSAVVKSKRHKAHIRTDKLALPIITIPISTLK